MTKRPWYTKEPREVWWARWIGYVTVTLFVLAIAWAVAR